MTDTTPNAVGQLAADRRHYPMYIDGDWVDAEDRFKIITPATEELVATVARGGVQHADQAVAAAARAHARGEWRSHTPEQRAAVLSELAAGLSSRIDDLVRLEVRETGAPIRQARAFHVGSSVSHLRYFADLVPTGSSARVPGCGSRGSLPAMSGASRSASSPASSPGTSRCGWPSGSSDRRWRPATASCSSRTRRPP